MRRLGRARHAAHSRSSTRACSSSTRSTTAFELSNAYAPEHLILQVANARDWLPKVRNAGSVFLGAWTPETMGDYCSGTNHVLPTYGFARAYSGLSLHDFVKRMTVQELTADGLRDLGPTAITLAGTRRARCTRECRARPSRAAGTGARMNPILELARPDILSLQPYQHAAWEPSLERMHANEMPWRASGDTSSRRAQPLSRAAAAELIAHLAALYGVAPDSVLAGRGSDEGIDLLVRAFCRAGQDSVLICPPTFGMYKVSARIQGAGVVEVPLLKERGFALDAQAVLAAWRSGVKLVFLCSPNNPTGNASGSRGHRVLCASSCATRAIVVVDEAYIEFAARREPDRPRSSVSRTWSSCARCRRPMRWPARAAARCSRTPTSSACSRA